MGKYEPLREFLEKHATAEVRMTFTDLEKVLGFPLPKKSKHHRPWWSNNPDNNVMTKEWLAAGFRTEQVDVEGEKLVFRRIRREELDQPETDAPRRRRHPAFGALKDVTWIAPGVDLTQPADPEWADLIEDPNWHP
jgi:hypothetical protein